MPVADVARVYPVCQTGPMLRMAYLATLIDHRLGQPGDNAGLIQPLRGSKLCERFGRGFANVVARTASVRASPLSVNTRDFSLCQPNP